MSTRKMSKKALAEKELAENKKSACNASMALSDSRFNAMLTMHAIHPETDGKELFLLCDRNTQKILAGNTEIIETILMAQAHTLDCLFHKMTCNAASAEYIPAMQAYFDIALKAQKQCRQTLLALVDMKHPRGATFVKQQNNAINQQVNNGIQAEVFEKNLANELLREVEHAPVDR